jgi:uncharacterized membrane protein YcjF (UPF0283 family)
MNANRIASLLERILFLIALLLLALAVVEKIANWSGYTLIGQAYAPGRLAELGGIVLLLVITLLLREIRGGRRGAG